MIFHMNFNDFYGSRPKSMKIDMERSRGGPRRSWAALGWLLGAFGWSWAAPGAAGALPGAAGALMEATILSIL